MESCIYWFTSLQKHRQLCAELCELTYFLTRIPVWNIANRVFMILSDLLVFNGGPMMDSINYLKHTENFVTNIEKSMRQIAIV